MDRHPEELRRVEFWSSVELGGFCKGLVAALGKSKYTVFDKSYVSEASYRAARSLYARARLRISCYIVYPMYLRFWLMSWRCRRVHAVVISSNTFYAPRLATGSGVPVIHWVLDVFPEAFYVNKTLTPGGLVSTSVEAVMRQIFDSSALNVFLGPRLLAHARERFGEIPRAVVIEIGADGAAFRSFYPQGRSHRKFPKILYCGNYNRMHDADTVVEAILLGAADHCELEFRATGGGCEKIERIVKSDGRWQGKIVFGGALLEHEWINAMLDSDVALVTMCTGAERVIMPSKAYSALVAGQAILAVCPRNSDLADLIDRWGVGWIVEPGDAKGLLALICRLEGAPNEILEMRRRAWKTGHNVYDLNVIADKWADAFNKLSKN